MTPWEALIQRLRAGMQERLDEGFGAVPIGVVLLWADELTKAAAEWEQEREELRALVEKASPLPWRVRENDPGHIERDVQGQTRSYFVASTYRGEYSERPEAEQIAADAQLIVAAVNLLSRLKGSRSNG